MPVGNSFASCALAGNVQLFYLARIMGTSASQIDQPYGHLLPDSEDYLRGLLDNYGTATAAEGSTMSDERTKTVRASLTRRANRHRAVA
jgi:hypothetical protein